MAGGRVDIGAFELQALPTLVVNTLVDESDGDYSAGDLSLALAAAGGYFCGEHAEAFEPG